MLKGGPVFLLSTSTPLGRLSTVISSRNLAGILCCRAMRVGSVLETEIDFNITKPMWFGGKKDYFDDILISINGQFI